jgi:hypothetical protein
MYGRFGTVFAHESRYGVVGVEDEVMYRHCWRIGVVQYFERHRDFLS